MFIGIDYSISSPALCYIKEDKLNFVCITTKKLSNKTGNDIDIVFIPYPKWDSPQQRYDRLSSIFISYIIDNKPCHVFIEDYSFGSKGMVFNLAENCGILKYKLYTNNIRFSLLPPASIKKYATGKGNANKQSMLDSFKLKTNINLNELITINSDNPISDIVDSYYVLQYGIQTIKQDAL